MNDEPEVRAVVELVLDGPVISGVLHSTNDRDIPFTGWLGLIAALESCRGGVTS